MTSVGSACHVASEEPTRRSRIGNNNVSSYNGYSSSSSCINGNQPCLEAGSQLPATPRLFKPWLHTSSSHHLTEPQAAARAAAVAPVGSSNHDLPQVPREYEKLIPDLGPLLRPQDPEVPPAIADFVDGGITRNCPYAPPRPRLRPDPQGGHHPSMPYFDRAGVQLSLPPSGDEGFSSVVRHGAVNKRLFACPYCRYLTDRKNNLKRHVVTMHRKCDRTLECCGLVFGSKASLRDHVIVFHNAGYSCRHCGRNFCRKALLKRHLAVHSGRKDFSCDQCDYATSHKSNLDRHRKIHERIDKLSDSPESAHEVRSREKETLSSGATEHCGGRASEAYPKAETASDVWTDSSSSSSSSSSNDVDVVGGHVSSSEDRFPSPSRTVLPQTRATDDHLTYSINEHGGRLDESSNKVPSGPLPPHPRRLPLPLPLPMLRLCSNVVYADSAFGSFQSQTNLFQRSSGIFQQSCRPSFFSTSFDSCRHLGCSRPKDDRDPTSLDPGCSAFFRRGGNFPEGIGEEVPESSRPLPDSLRVGSRDPSFPFNGDSYLAVAATSSSSAGRVHHHHHHHHRYNGDDVTEEKRLPVLEPPPRIFRIVDVISSDWEKKKATLKLGSGGDFEVAPGGVDVSSGRSNAEGPQDI